MPPSTVFASFNSYGSAQQDKVVSKDIEVYRFNNHEGGQEHHWMRQIHFLRRLLEGKPATAYRSTEASMMLCRKRLT